MAAATVAGIETECESTGMWQTSAQPGVATAFASPSPSLASIGWAYNAQGGNNVAGSERRVGGLRPRSVPAWLGLSAAALGLAACSSATVDTQARAPNFGCVDDSKACVDQRQATLKGLLADPKRTWVRDQASPGAYASGVRMFAFKLEKAKLNCDELGAGRREADGAPQVLRGPNGQGLTPAQISRGIMFAGDVSKELTTEMKRRCRV